MQEADPNKVSFRTAGQVEGSPSEALNEDWLRQNNWPFSRPIKPQYFQSKRWFGSKSRVIQDYRLVDFQLLPNSLDQFGLLLLEIQYNEGEPEAYQLPLVFITGRRWAFQCEVPTGGRHAGLSDSGRGIWGL